MTTAEQYRSTSLHLYDQAIEELDEGDLLQASEKLWGAAAQALNPLLKGEDGSTIRMRSSTTSWPRWNERPIPIAYVEILGSRRNCTRISTKTGSTRIKSVDVRKTCAISSDSWIVWTSHTATNVDSSNRHHRLEWV